jgi:hypothetical protein
MADPGTRFFKKTSVLYDTELNSIYSDLPYGQKDVINITGGPDPAFNYLDVKVAPKPKFGAGEIDSLRLKLYGNSVTTGSGSGLINLAAYRVKKDHNLGDNEGTFNIGTKKITVVTANADMEKPWLVEGFDRAMTSDVLNSEFEVISGTIVKKTDPYIFVDGSDGALENQTFGYNPSVWSGGDFMGSKISRTEMMKLYGTTVDGLGDVIYVERRFKLPFTGEWKSVKGRTWGPDVVWFSSEKWGWYIARKNRVKVHYSVETPVEIGVNPNQITKFNSMFDDTRTSEGYFEEMNSDGTANYIAVAQLIQSTALVASGGSSLLFNSLWKTDTAAGGDYGGDVKVRGLYTARSIANTALMGTNSTSDGTISGPRGRQELYITKKNIPLPIKTQSGNFTGPPGTTTNGGDCMFDSAIELDINFDAQEIAHTAVFTNSGGGDGGSDLAGGRKPSTIAVKAGSPVHATLRRATVYTMTDEKPEDNQDLYTFLSQNYCHNWSVSGMQASDASGGAGTTHTKFTVIATGPCGNVNNSSSSRKVGSIAANDRVYFSHMNSQYLNHDVSQFSDGTIRLPQNGYLVTWVNSSNIVIDLVPSADDPVQHTTTANSHSDNVGYGTIFKYSNKNFYGMAFLNMSGKTPDWANGDSLGSNSARRYFHLSGGTADITTFKTNHHGIIPLPFTGRSINNDNLTESGTLDHGLQHSWVPNATTQDFVHGCQSYGDLDNAYVDRWYNTLETSKWYTLGFHFNPNSAKCYFMANALGSNSSEDFELFEATVGDRTHPSSGHFMPNMKAASNGTFHGNYARASSSGITDDNWPGNVTVWSTNVDFHNQAEQSKYLISADSPYQRATTAVSTVGTTTTASPWWMGIEDSEISPLYAVLNKRDTKSKVYMDQFRFVGFNLSHENATISLGNTHHSAIKFNTGETRKMFHYDHYEDLTGNQALFANTKPNLTYVSLGFDNRTDIESAERYMLWSGFATSNISNINALEAGGLDVNSAPDGNLFVGFSSDELLGYQISALNSMKNTIVAMTSNSTSVTVKTGQGYDNRRIVVGQKVEGLGLTAGTYVTSVGSDASPMTFTINQASTGGTVERIWSFRHSKANLEIDVDSDSDMITTLTNSVDKFRGKGFVKFDFEDSTLHWNSDANTTGSLTKRENVAASARVVDYSKGDNKVTKVTIDDPSIFNLDADTKYIMYLYGKVKGTSSNKIVDLTLTAGPDMNDTDNFYEIELSADVEDLGGTGNLAANIAKGIVMISPYKYWLTMEVNKEEGAAQSYGSVLMAGPVTDGDDSTNPLVAGFRGATYNESIYNDTDVSGVYSPNINSHALGFGNDYPIVELNKDYGLGSYDPETDKGGMVVTLYPTTAWNEFRLDNVISTDTDLTHDDTVSFLIKPTDVIVDHAVGIRSTEHATVSSRPYMLTGMFDELPNEVEDFKVAPSEKNNFHPSFTWSTQDSDLWYSFIIIDDSNISNQYQNAILHYPLNETGAHGVAATSAQVENISGVTTTSAVATYDVEGLAGYSLRFDGASGTYVKSGTGSADPTAGATTEMSLVAHVVHDSAAVSGDQFIINQSTKIIVKVIDGGQIEASLYATPTSWVTLTSSSLIPTDGETPLNIIVTFDNSLKGNNMKLFIDGVLEDQTGPQVTMVNDSASTGWHLLSSANLPLNVTSQSTNYMYIGNAADNTSTGFIGRIEEVVVYNKAIYPVIPEDGKYVLTKPIEELTTASVAQSKTNIAKLFVKDFHNIRGSRTTDVRASQNISWRKAGFALDTS